MHREILYYMLCMYSYYVLVPRCGLEHSVDDVLMYYVQLGHLAHARNTRTRTYVCVRAHAHMCAYRHIITHTHTGSRCSITVPVGFGSPNKDWETARG